MIATGHTTASKLIARSLWRDRIRVARLLRAPQSPSSTASRTPRNDVPPAPKLRLVVSRGVVR